ncbi:MAG TPA: hypothetical protein VF576_13345 [Rubricoccaceae bacterium]|jgi:hypothetical protein
MPRPPVRSALSALALLVAGCDGFSSEEQLLFEDTAYRSPSDGVTADDWRAGPAFGSRVQVIQGASPNPAPQGELVSVQVYVEESVGRPQLFYRRPDGGFSAVGSIPLGPLYTFTFLAGEVSETGAPGSYRLVVLNGLDDVMTYGDLVLQ